MKKSGISKIPLQVDPRQGALPPWTLDIFAKRCSDKKERSNHLHKHIGHASRYTGKGGKKCGKCKKINVSAYKLLSELCKETLGDGVKTAAIAKFHKFAGVKTAAKYLKILTFAMDHSNTYVMELKVTLKKKGIISIVSDN
ncbi:hypothetical protein IEQ34_020619 [Dendrobium chrysotoxum]|uniref:Uncharacterized protein n=1 Tax=Dendrobium chrysotoxum TaxID=161865 RepID=A0AAV7G3A0_DENCH|nr:hypothetical protein IEQ34_020619 [Dendrobium chrysotoxum]